MKLNDQLLDAYSEFNDAAVATTTCQLAQATEAGQRLELARKRFQILFMSLRRTLTGWCTGRIGLKRWLGLVE